jgi:hypothetical protein
MPVAGWPQMIPPASWCRGPGRYPIDAYSEFMPPPRLGIKAYGGAPPDQHLFSRDDPFGFRINEFEEARELQPGLGQIADRIVHRVGHLLRGEKAQDGVPPIDLVDNPYWPPELAERCGSLTHDRGVVLAPLALSRSQDDKGRVRWTLFGGSEQGPAKPFWKSFFTAPGREGPTGVDFFCRLLNEVYGTTANSIDDLHHTGFRILPTGGHAPLPLWDEGKLPAWAEPLGFNERKAGEAKYLLTFRPFSALPAAVRKSYLAGDLHLLPSPAALVFWGCPRYLKLHRELPLALQIPLLHATTRRRDPFGFRVPQSGFMHVPAPGHESPHPHAGPVRNTYKRTHRWDRILRDQDELALLTKEQPLLHALFSTIPEDIDLYDKPLARNVQLWTVHGDLMLDGPRATPDEIRKVFHTVEAGGTFGYRFQWPAMRVGRYEIYWHRILAAYAKGDGVAVVPDAPLGYLTAYATSGRKSDPRTGYEVSVAALEDPLELWPRPYVRPVPAAVVTYAAAGTNGKHLQTARNVRMLFDAADLAGEPLARRFARRLLSVPRETTLDAWLGSLPAGDLANGVRTLVQPVDTPLPRRRSDAVPNSLTFGRTARRAFEVTYWKTIVALAESQFLNKNNADCIRDAKTQHLLTYQDRQLDELGDFLLAYYRKQIAAAKLGGKAVAGSVPFQWRTDFEFCWMGGWEKNREAAAERDILVAIPGKDRSRAVIMADHYDTAYMCDRYDPQYGGHGARIAACGADDNHSATAAMMLAAPLLLAMSKAGKLGCDVWLVHLTGEEFPADCLGARALTERLIEGTLALHSGTGKPKDLSKVQVQGVYVSDMIAHNNDHDRDVFQITPGTGRGSLWLAEQANIAAETWNESVPIWNRQANREGRPRGRRSPHGAAIPEIAQFLSLDGQVRPVTDPRSTLYNTDGQIFSDAGVPVVLFMENYDINRMGYHDTQDTMANIDLDYGAALAAITIEAVARAATAEPPG